MWVFLPNCFVSIVADKTDPEKRVIRGRVKGDVRRFLLPVWPECGPEIEAAGTDYAVRITVNECRVNAALRHWNDAMEYTNFKDACRESIRHEAYMDVWGVMMQLQNWCNPVRRFTDGVKRLARGRSINATSRGWLQTTP